MNVKKIVLGSLVTVLFIVAFIFKNLSASTLNYVDWYYFGTVGYGVLGVISLALGIPALIIVAGNVVMACIKSKNRSFLKVDQILCLIGAILAISASAVMLASAIVDTCYGEDYAIARIAITGVLFILAIVFGSTSMSSSKEALAPKSEFEKALTGSGSMGDVKSYAFFELDHTKEVEKTVQLFSNSNVGIGFWTNICYSFCNLFGMKSATYDNKMRRIQMNVLSGLVSQAKQLGADTVTDVHFALSNLTVAVSGTAVFYKK